MIICNEKCLCFRRLKVSPLYLKRGVVGGSTSKEPQCRAATAAQNILNVESYIVDVVF